MIEVPPGKKFEFHSPQRLSESKIEEILRLIRSTASFVGDVNVLNKTKSCVVTIVMENGKMQIIIRNPRDEEFDVNELENPVTPVQITGR